MQPKPYFVKNDPWLEPYSPKIEQRLRLYQQKKEALTNKDGRLSEFANGHLFYGLHHDKDGWVIREWAPNATAIFLIGSFNDWRPVPGYQFTRQSNDIWELRLPHNAISHQALFQLHIEWQGGAGTRLPSYTKRAVQDPDTLIFSAQAWVPDEPYEWKHESKRQFHSTAYIYEAHVGMSGEEPSVSSFNEFREQILPRIAENGYNTIQLMAIQEHPYYGSFGYHVSNFFAVSSRFGTPDELKQLIDEAHSYGLMVIIDLVHSHAVKNEHEGLALFDGTPYQYFHDGPRREHQAWDSLCFDYGKNQVLHYLLSNCKFWLDEYHLDGFRFDGVTSMLYLDHGLSRDFGSYDDYYDDGQDEDAITYLRLANELIHETQPHAITVAEEMSGMPGIATPLEDGGYGFDYRLAMGTPDYWIKIIKELADEEWNISEMFRELTNKRADEKTIGYAESHDQALVGDKTIIFRLMDQEMYFSMAKNQESLVVDRGIALHKMIRLITLATAGNGYLNFMGNEFGHPEWIDFPREGNNWSFHYARRQWSLVDNKKLKYHYLRDFDKDMIHRMQEAELYKDPFAHHLYENTPDQVLAFSRQNLVFIFNFHPSTSYEGYGIPVEEGKYQVILDSDQSEYGGHQRVDNELTYYTHRVSEHRRDLKIYLPNRTALVLRRLKMKKVHD